MQVKYENGNYIFVGEFDYGFGGKFKNDENGNGNIKLLLDEDSFELLKAKPTDSKIVIKKLTKKIKKFQKIIKRHNRALRYEYLFDVFFDLLAIDTEKRFWQSCNTVKGYNNDEKTQKQADEIIAGYLKRSEGAISNATELFYKVFDFKLRWLLFLPNIEKYVRKNFKFYDFDLFFASIIPEELIFDPVSFGIVLKNKVADDYIDEYGYRFDKHLEKICWW